ncbi:ABC transporter ATP-binding protein [Lysinibacillus telephonicus]|uniref:ABC transporter ATP-binding protein n=1 Tax=Lysinibacillus telephonicus TaxID=1714840 RepID=A0A3S0JSR4_9BACI|nr:ABC transporter ATP-binding protein [Lysinibacillus telephonicus]RTQ93985.1 ABC transporter ATP-binding protein [Lysinibacillus telephonicus]
MFRVSANTIEVKYDKKIILKDLLLHIPDKSISTIIGPNGCGKSTLLKALTKILPYSKGQILLDGQALNSYKTKELAKKMALLPQSQITPAQITVRELVAYGRYPHQGNFGILSSQDREIIDWAISKTKLNDVENATVDSLSGGQRQRVWIALALAQQTDIIYLDEPTTYLDLAHQLELMKFLKQLNEEENRTIVMVLHDLNLAARFSDYMISMNSGQIIKAGTVEEVMTTTNLKHVFQIDAVISKDPYTGKPICLSYNTSL